MRTGSAASMSELEFALVLISIVSSFAIFGAGLATSRRDVPGVAIAHTLVMTLGILRAVTSQI